MLKFRYSRTVSDGYGDRIKQNNISLKRFKKILKRRPSEKEIFIKSNYNRYHYRMHDLDTVEEYNDYIKLLDKPYVTFKSSPGHFWVIVDDAKIHIRDILNDTEWITHNDKGFVRACQSNNLILLRGLYEDFKRKPKIYYKSDDLSENFKQFIKSLISYYNSDALELSVLRYDNKEMFAIFHRKEKMNRIINE